MVAATRAATRNALQHDSCQLVGPLGRRVGACVVRVLPATCGGSLPASCADGSASPALAAGGARPKTSAGPRDLPARVR
eukprot:15448116-Alexandrium_andersonii.AAC.1